MELEYHLELNFSKLEYQKSGRSIHISEIVVYSYIYIYIYIFMNSGRKPFGPITLVLILYKYSI